VLNDLRGRVVVQVDGQLKTGRDVVIGALLGADEFGFATAPLVVEGCIMMRKCHLNTCPVGVATQDPELRKKFAGQPEHVVNYFFFVAEEVRELMAKLGFRSFDEMVGRADLLDTPRRASSTGRRRARLLARLHHRRASRPTWRVLHREAGPRPREGARHRLIETRAARAAERRAVRDRDAHPQHQPHRRHHAQRARGRAALRSRGPARRHDPRAFAGTAGQSFGAFLARGITLELDRRRQRLRRQGPLGRADHRLAAAEVPHLRPEENIIVGNTVLYGAIAGEAFFRGVGGERFCVRNSGALAVVEGVGDHGCEYMTGGTVVVLGMTGRNFAAGMSGGVAYVLDEDGSFATRCNTTEHSRAKAWAR
jgi:glutamate synthase (NADPH/NADH) large chain